jgi:tetratricopeptide (TPR) repeat protein
MNENRILLEQAESDFAGERFAEALESFRQLDPKTKEPLTRAREAFCMAKEGESMSRSIAACVDAVRSDPKKSELYLILGRLHVLGGQKKAAIRVFNLGLRAERNLRLIDELAALGVRRPPPLPFLPRENFINKQLGLLLRKLGLR